MIISNDHNSNHKIIYFYQKYASFKSVNIIRYNIETCVEKRVFVMNFLQRVYVVKHVLCKDTYITNFTFHRALILLTGRFVEFPYKLHDQ